MIELNKDMANNIASIASAGLELYKFFTRTEPDKTVINTASTYLEIIEFIKDKKNKKYAKTVNS